MFARPFDSAMVAARALWSTKCSVDTNVTAAGRGSGSSLLRASLSVAATPPPWRAELIVATYDRLEECTSQSTERGAR
jgi:hypothetical protein